MTLEEAIKTYTNNAEHERRNGNLQGCLDFRQLADWLKELKALKEQQPCDDTISRQAVLDLIVVPMPTLTQNIKELPPVTPRQKMGRWIPVEYPTGVEAFGVKEMTAMELRCSVCGKEVDISDGDFKFCPNCGAKMTESEENNG